MYSVKFHDTLNSKQLILSVVKNAGYAFIMPFMPVLVNQIILTQVVSGVFTDIAKVPIGTVIPDLKHLALTVDGTTAKIYFRGRLIAVATMTTTMTIDRMELAGGTQATLHSEMVLDPQVATPETIATWSNLRAPFFDPSPVIQESQIPAAETWNKAVHDAQRALADAADAQATADGKVTTYYQDTEPIAEALGDLWVHTGEDNKLYRWSGSSWEVVQDKKIQEAVQKAEDAQATADGKIVTFYQSTPPTATAIGDLWVDVGDNNRLYRWSGSVWADINDMTPIDASQRPVSVQGAGGRIEMDKYGQRFIRASDNKVMIDFDVETGNANFAGDISGASGTFTGPVKSMDSEGNYSLLDEARLRFYRRIGDEDVLSYYVAQIATGQAVDGEVVDLGLLGYRFFEPPKVVLQPKLNRVFVANTTTRDVWMDWDVENQTFDPDTGTVTFKVRCRTIMKGGLVVGSFTPNKLKTEGASTTSTTGPGTTYLEFQFGGYAYEAFVFGSAKIEFNVRYRKIGATSWTLLDTQSFSKYSILEFTKTLTYNVPNSGTEGYEVRVTLVKLSANAGGGSAPGEARLTINEFKHRSGDTILSDPDKPEIVSWIAIDGG